MEPIIPRSLNDDQIKEIKSAFDLFDIDGTGKIDPREICMSLHTLGVDNVREEIKTIVKSLETTNKVAIDFPEFLKLVSGTLQSRDPLDEIEKAFMRFDDDATNKISFRNLKRVALELGEQLTDAELREILKAADKDGDGEITKEEFIELMQNTDLF